jgi:hypothetical protein
MDLKAVRALIFSFRIIARPREIMKITDPLITIKYRVLLKEVNTTSSLKILA